MNTIDPDYFALIFRRRADLDFVAIRRIVKRLGRAYGLPCIDVEPMVRRETFQSKPRSTAGPMWSASVPDATTEATGGES